MSAVSLDRKLLPHDQGMSIYMCLILRFTGIFVFCR
jgi:hypothetical protein